MKLIHAIMKKSVFYRKADGEILSETKKAYKIKLIGIGSIVSILKKDIEKVTIYTPPPLAIHVFG